MPEYSLVLYIYFGDYRLISGNIIAPDSLSQLLYTFSGLFIFDYEVIIYVIVVLHTLQNLLAKRQIHLLVIVWHHVFNPVISAGFVFILDCL